MTLRVHCALCRTLVRIEFADAGGTPTVHDGGAYGTREGDDWSAPICGECMLRAVIDGDVRRIDGYIVEAGS